MKGRRRRCRDASRRQAATCNGDMLSRLPDDALIDILERLGTLDAIRTCLLSKRMLGLPAMLSRVSIDFDGAVSRAADDDGSSMMNKRDLVRINGAVADVTDRILSARSRDIPVRGLKLRFFLTRYDCLSIGKSVARAMAARKLDLDGAVEFEVLTLTKRDSEQCTDADLRRFGEQFNTFLGDCPDAFACLTRLHLRNLRFGRSEDIPDVLGACGRLESLRLHECDAGLGSFLRVEHPRLVELEIFGGGFETVELACLPKLQRMSYNNWRFDEEPLFLGDVPQLSTLSLTKTCYWGQTVVLSQLLANAPTVTDLQLDFQSERIWVRPETPRLLAPVLQKLRRLNMDFLPQGCDIAWTMFFLQAAPALQELSLMVWDHWCGMDKQHSHCDKRNVEWEPSTRDFKHKNLAKLTIHGFQSDDIFTGYIRRIMEAAVNIEEISLHDRKVCKTCPEKLNAYGIKVFQSGYPRTSKEKDSLREKITEGLVMASPAVIHFRS